MLDKVMATNGNSVKPLLKYTPENFDDIEKESKQNQKQYYNGKFNFEPTPLGKITSKETQYIRTCEYV